jgi:hypothetical protein
MEQQMSWNQSVYNSNVRSIGWDKEGLTVWWASGRISKYAGVPEGTARAVANSVDPTAAINTAIKASYPHTYLQPERDVEGGARGKSWT